MGEVFPKPVNFDSIRVCTNISLLIAEPRVIPVWAGWKEWCKGIREAVVWFCLATIMYMCYTHPYDVDWNTTPTADKRGGRIHEAVHRKTDGVVIQMGMTFFATIREAVHRKTDGVVIQMGMTFCATGEAGFARQCIEKPLVMDAESFQYAHSPTLSNERKSDGHDILCYIPAGFARQCIEIPLVMDAESFQYAHSPTLSNERNQMGMTFCATCPYVDWNTTLYTTADKRRGRIREAVHRNTIGDGRRVFSIRTFSHVVQ
ncbi:hypothetical protein C8J57DRAFT_1237976 [Mycena rebaudengoi]|nr:hypothetical protein C8J57DRAFT_1237976 [Mycena rebaudengoi]